jgi:hypothetical protein
MFEAIDRLRGLESDASINEDTPLADILKMANG